MFTTQVSVQSNLADSLAISTAATTTGNTPAWKDEATTVPSLTETAAYSITRPLGDYGVWTFTTTATVAGTGISLQVKASGSWLSSSISIQVATTGTGGQSSGWSSAENVSVSFTGDDGNNYVITGALISPSPLEEDNVLFSVATTVLPQITNLVVLMMENRSLDNLLGWIYDGTNPAQVLPAGSPAAYNGLSGGSYSNTAAGVNNGNPVAVTNGTTDWPLASPPGSSEISEYNVPSPDPGEVFDDVTDQIAGSMGGFLANYLAQVNAAGNPPDTAQQIMQSYSTAQLPVLSGLATGYAVSDAWFASVPTQTFPNRDFLLCGSSGGHVNNVYFPLDLTSVFDLLDTQGIDWMVYSDNPVSLVQALFVKQWTNTENFGNLSDFQAACQGGTLPPFTFLEPPFGVEFGQVTLQADGSYHPPYDVTNGETYLSTVAQAIQGSPDPNGILFVVLFDEHGGTYDHVQPPTGAQPPSPDPVATDGSGFTFDRFGVRVPAILVSPYVTPGTVFRSPTDVPFDHTSVLATLRDWLGLQVAFANVLPSPRIAAAPTFTSVLGSTPAANPAPVPAPLPVDPSTPHPPDDTPLNDIQRVIAVAAAAKAAGQTLTPEQWTYGAQRLGTVADLKAFVARYAPGAAQS